MLPMQVPDGDLDVVMGGLTRTANVARVLVTMPHKRTAVGYCATSSERARMLGVVSVTRRNPDGTWHGDMLDGVAFLKAQEGGRPTQGSAGAPDRRWGAGSAIAVALLKEGVRELIIHDEDDTRSSQLAELLSGLGGGRVSVGGPGPRGCDMVFNATPMGMAEDDPLPLDPEALTSSMFVGDVIAGHGVTPLVKAAKAAGCQTASGGEMVEAVQDLMVAFMLDWD